MKLKYVVLGLVFVLLFGIGCLYFLFRTKTLIVVNELPFSEIIHQKQTTKRRVVIAENPDQPINEKFVYVLEDGTNYSFENLTTIKEIPIGTPIHIQSVELRKGSVSGTTTAYVFGSIAINNKEYFFHYAWGDHHWLQEEKPYWTFPLAAWQDQVLNGRYSLKEL